MVPFDYTSFANDMHQLVKSGYIPMKRINDAVSRILRVKFTMGLFENPLGDRSLTSMVGAQVSYHWYIYTYICFSLLISLNICDVFII